MYAIGVIAYELIMGHQPLIATNKSDLRKALIETQIKLNKALLPQGYPKEAADFTNKLLKKLPSKRLGNKGINELKEHPWFKNFDWEGLRN